eukprot:COSAG01_NODE_67953_length_265_cov_1.138554_1_plen_61_part_10
MNVRCRRYPLNLQPTVLVPLFVGSLGYAMLILMTERVGFPLLQTMVGVPFVAALFARAVCL